MSRQDHTQIYQMLSVFLMSVSKGEHILQCLKEVLTSHPLFNPLGLFRYISKNCHYISAQNLLTFLSENNSSASHEDLKLLMMMEGKVQTYSNFLDFVYPHNGAILREIAANKLKNYPELEKYCVDEQVISTFFLLLNEEISFINKLEYQKYDSLMKIPKEKLKKVIKSIKKAGDKHPNHCENSQDVITSLELRNFMKAFINIQDNQFLHLSRKLEMEKGVFSIEKIQNFLKPWKKSKRSDQIKNIQLRNPHNNQNKFQNYSQEKLIQQNHNGMRWSQNFQKKQDIKIPLKQFDQKLYKKQLYQQLSNTLNLGDNRIDKANPKSKAQQETQKKKLSILKNQPEKNTISHKLFQQQDQYILNNKKSPHEGPKELFKQFIQLFLPFSKNIEMLKGKLARFQIDFLRLFKKIDKKQRGVICAEDLVDFYGSIGGKTSSIHYFSLLIKSYAQSEDDWLSYSQFCDIFRPDSKQNQDFILAADFDQPTNAQDSLKSANQLMVNILDQTLQNQNNLFTIRSRFKKHQSKQLFNAINKQQNGFINYQELKNYLGKECGVNLMMHQLMSLLKKLDRSKNGVVVENEFVGYFQPEVEACRPMRI